MSRPRAATTQARGGSAAARVGPAPFTSLLRAGPLLFFCAACGPAPDATTPGGRGPAPAAGGSCDRPTSLRAVSDPGRSSPIVLGSFEEGPLAGHTLAFVADEDGHAVVLVDVDAKKQLASVEVGGAPSELLIASDGRLLATVRSTSRVAVLAAAPSGGLELACTRETSAEPIALAERPAGDGFYVTAGWGAALDVFDRALAKQASVSLPRDPRQIVLDEPGKTAFVAHAVGGRISVVDLAGPTVKDPIELVADPSQAPSDGAEPSTLEASVARAVSKAKPRTPGEDGLRVGSQGYGVVVTREPKGRLLAPQVLVDPGDPGGRSEGYGAGSPTVLPNVAVIDVARRVALGASLDAQQQFAILESFDGRRGPRGESLQTGCLLPRGAALHHDSVTLVVTCLGSDVAVAYDAASPAPNSVETGRWDVGSGPAGVAIDGRGRALVFSRFERTIDVLEDVGAGAVLPPAQAPRRVKIDLTPLRQPLPLGVLLGRQIFHAVGDPRISSEGVACASCHPDGREDGLSWLTAAGVRRTPTLAGRMEAPLGWDGGSEDLERFMDGEFSRLHGQGLRGVQLEALVTYLGSLPPPPPSAPGDQASVARGKALFEARKCSSCHPGGGTDGKAHDVGSRRGNDRKSSFDTPSLRHLRGRAPYFHDGRFATLKDLLREPHGEKVPAPLKDDELAALEAYLKTL